MYGSTMMQGQTQLFPIANNYREVDSIQGNVTVFHDAMKVGSSYAIVAPGYSRSYLFSPHRFFIFISNYSFTSVPLSLYFHATNIFLFFFFF